jgi:hypothetical protein
MERIFSRWGSPRLPACLPACLCMPARPHRLPAPACLPVSLHACLLVCTTGDQQQQPQSRHASLPHSNVLPPRLACCLRYTWSIYANRLVTLSHVYTFWKRVTSLESRETKRYLGGVVGWVGTDGWALMGGLGRWWACEVWCRGSAGQCRARRREQSRVDRRAFEAERQLAACIPT